MKHLTKTLVFAACAVALVACKKEATENSDGKDSKTAPATDPAPKTVGGDKAGDKAGEKPSATTGFGDAVGKYKVDTVHSAVNFKIEHMKVSHTLGRFNKVTGTLNLTKDPAASSVALSVEAGSIFTADKKRDQHLKGPDFLNVAQFPTVEFKSTKLEATSGANYRVTGDLKLHGVTKSVVADFEHVGSGASMMDPKMFLTGFTGTLNIKRTDFGMDKLVGPAGDNIELTIAIEGLRQ